MSPSSHDAWGFDFRVRADADRADAVDRLFAGLPAGGPTSTAPFEYALSADDPRPFGDAVSAVVAAVTMRAIEAAEGSLLLHAGAVCTARGDAAIICGPSGSGKSTLTVKLVETGLGYVTDEAVRLDPSTLRITPFRKPVSVKPGSRQVLGHLRPTTPELAEGMWIVPPADFEVLPPPARLLTPRLLVFPTFEAGAESRAEPITEGEAAHLLGTNSSRLREVRGGPLPALARLARRAPAYRLRYGDVASAVQAVGRVWP